MNKLNVSDKLGKLRKVVRSRGVGGTLAAGIRYVIPPKAKSVQACRELVAGRRGLEIGGPSLGFGRKGYLPIYQHIAGLDNCNFGAETIWEGSLAEGLNFQYDPERPKGRQYIAEAADLKPISDKSYDFVLSCHSIEHTANPLRALKEWMRVMKDEGGLVLIVPHKEETFDRRRPVTTLQHLIEDFEKNTGEDDLTHRDEVWELHDLDRDWGRSDRNELQQRLAKNPENRCIHHHVFNTALVVEMVNYAGLQIISVEAIKPFHIIVAARKPPPGQSPKNDSFRSPTAAWRQASAFQLDH